MSHPYANLPDHAFWRRAVAGQGPGLLPIAGDFLCLTPDDKVMTAGSCFAQHIGRHLAAAGYAYLVTERAHPVILPEVAHAAGYGVFTARYGNIYTTRQFVQLIDRAYGRFVPVERPWEGPDGTLVDPFRPTIQPGGFGSEEELADDRAHHFACVRAALETLDVLVFTLGLTEMWVSQEDGAAFPLCPGVAGGRFDPARHAFVNLRAAEVRAELGAAIAALRRVNPKARILLTVSPVPLTATASGNHILAATTYSKSVLRVAAHEAAEELTDVHYFPSFEIVTGPQAGGRFFAPNLREVTPDGVARVMATFLRAVAGADAPALAMPAPAAPDADRSALAGWVEAMCDEAMLDRRATRDNDPADAVRAATLADRHRIAVLVLGMHRSGTSALTWLLGEMGAALPCDAIAASDDNSKGYWESVGLVAADDALVRAAGSSWFDFRALDLARIPASVLTERRERIRAAIADGWGEAPLLAIKDPRQCRFVPIVVAELDALGIGARAVLMLRGAGEVAASLLRRDATIVPYGLLLWLRHMLDAERDTRAMPRVIVSYDGLLANWRATAARIAPLIGREGWSPADGGAAVDAFVDPQLRHHVDQDSPPHGAIGELIAAAERAFAALLVADDAEAHAAIDRVRERWAAMPWLEGDIVHDELRHRRVPAVEAPAPEASEPEPAPSAPPEADHDADADLVRGSGLFDTDWYRATYPDAAASGLDPVTHYLRVGAAKGYNPNPLFDTGYYARQMARRGVPA